MTSEVHAEMSARPVKQKSSKRFWILALLSVIALLGGASVVLESAAKRWERIVAPLDNPEKSVEYGDREIADWLDALGATRWANGQRPIVKLNEAVYGHGPEGFDDRWLKCICRHQGLQLLRMPRTSITDAGMTSLLHCRQLETLKIEDSNITDQAFGAIRSLEQLNHIHILNCPVTGEFLEDAAYLPFLNSFGAVGTQFDDRGGAHLARSKRLTMILLDNTPISDRGIVDWEMPKLSHLDLQTTRVTGIGFQDGRRFPGLWTLNLRYSPITDAGLAKIATLPKLKFLSLDYSNVTGKGLAAFAESKSLQALSLNGCEIDGESLRHLRHVESLISLQLNDTSLTDAAAPHIAAMPGLKVVYLADTQLTDIGLEALAESKTLEHINAARTEITDETIVKVEAASPKLNVYSHD